MTTTEVTSFFIDKERHELATAKIGILKPYAKACKKLNVPSSLRGLYMKYLTALHKDGAMDNKYQTALSVIKDRLSESYLK